MRKFILLIILLLCMSLASAQCIEPEQGLEISQDTSLCSGTYVLSQGLEVTNSQVILSCDQTTLSGNQIGAGVLVDGQEGVTIEGCTIQNFEIGVYLKNSPGSTLTNSVLEENKVGVGAVGQSQPELVNTLFINNIQDQTTIEPETTQETQEENPVTPSYVFEQKVLEESSQKTPQEVQQEVDFLLSKYFATQEKLVIDRSFVYDGEKTQIRLKITPSEQLSNVQVYDSIPKCVTQYLNQIVFASTNFEVIEQDPLIMWTFPYLDQPTEVTYHVFKEIDQECRELFSSFGLADQAVALETTGQVVAKPEHSYYLGLALTVGVALFALVFFGGRIFEEIHR